MAEYIIDVLADGIEQGSINTSGNTPDSRMVRSAGYLEFLGDDDGIITVSATATTGRTIMVSFLGYASNTTNNPLFAWYWYGLPHNFDVSAYPNVKYFRLVLIYEGYSTLTPEEVASCTIEYSYTVPWYMDGEQPTPTAALPILQEHFTKPYPASLWRIDENNGGLPYNDLMLDVLYVVPEPPPPPPPPGPTEIPTVQPIATTEIADQTSIQWKRYTVGYTNPDLFRFRDGGLPENTKCDVFIKGTNSYRYTEERDHIDGSQTTETP